MKINKTISTISLTLLIAFGAIFISLNAIASEEPSSLIESTVNSVKKIVVEKKSTTSPEELNALLREKIAPVFDFREMSRRCLGARWNDATPPQQEEFQDLFSSLLAKNYLKQIREKAPDSIFSTKEAITRGNRAVVQTLVTNDIGVISIDYRLIQRNGTWKVYDVIIENIGLVSNYRSEFSDIIQKDGVGELLVKLREKLDQ